LRQATKVAITAGASAPELLVQQVVDRLAQLGFTRVEEVEMVDEDVKFPLPPELAPHAPLLTTISQM
jgi:4-hydroxy-3-methylbut-2-enyl diphosphate reductase